MTSKSEQHGQICLVVDDEEMLRDLAQEWLDQAGIEVLTAENGMQAIELLRQHLGAVGCVVLDMVMPEMDGIETFTRLRQLDPEIPVILSSGYSEDEAVQKMSRDGLVGVLKKPYPLTALERVVKRSLGL